MPAATPATLVKTLRDRRLLDARHLAELARASGRFGDAHSLAKDLIQRGWLTPFQVNYLLKGKADELVLGAYVLLERIGEGGMGQVYKARHQNLDRVVALKVLRQDLLKRDDLVKRFHREIQLVATLSHPNIVLAFDADCVNGQHFLAMEYVEGVDLSRLVQSRGPQGVRDSCDFIRQAALGLQHAHERGLVHRDIKPSNLLRTNQGNTVKILDLGLARLQESADDDMAGTIDAPAGARAQSLLTQAGRVMGTPDYIAPEQARNSHTVDIRADIYSLGCTFYYLLTGKPPFAGASFIEKLFKHQSETAPAVEQLRREVPPAVGAVVRKLMAKKPEQRYQTPGELAAALAALTAPGVPTQATPLPGIGARRTGYVSVPLMVASVVEATPPAEATASWENAAVPAAARPAGKAGWSWVAMAGIVGGVLVCVGALLALARLPAIANLIDPKPASTPTAGDTARAPRPLNVIYLSDLAEEDPTVGLGKFGKNGELGIDGRRIMVKGVPSPRGLSMHPPSVGTAHVTYSLGGQYHEFKTAAAINDRSPKDKGGGAEGPVVFTVIGDGVILWRSRKPLQDYGASEHCSVRVSGVDRLELTVECPGKNNERAYAVWVEPHLAKGPPR